MRARLERDPPLIGDPQVALDIEPGSSGAAPTAMNGIPQIPAAPQTGINAIVNRIDKVPIDQIARNLLDTTHHLDALVSSPQIADAIDQLDAALKQIRETADNAGPKVAKLTDSLRRTAARLDETAKAADRLLGGSASQTGTQQALSEITDAARSVRELADYLDRHPEALVEGRSGE
jgi:paraquat-inducible protein B